MLVDAEAEVAVPGWLQRGRRGGAAVDRIRETAAGTAIDATLAAATTMIVVGVEGTIAAAAEVRSRSGIPRRRLSRRSPRWPRRRDRGRGYDDRDRRGGYDDRDRGRGYDDRDRRGGYGDGDRGYKRARSPSRAGRPGRGPIATSRDRGGDWGRYDERDRKRYRDEGGARDARDDKPPPGPPAPPGPFAGGGSDRARERGPAAVLC